MALPVAPTSPESAATDRAAHLEAALRHHQAGRLVEAAEAYRELLRRNPMDADAFLLLGIVARQSGYSAHSIALTQAAVRLCPQAAHYHLNLGHAFGCSNDVARTVSSYRAAIALSPGDPAARVCLGNFLFEQGDYAAAEAEYRQAARDHPKSAKIATHLGNCLLKQQRTIDATLWFLRALHLKPRSFLARHGLGCALAQAGRFQPAEASFRQAIALRPRSAEAYNSLGNVLYQQHRREEAAQAYCRALAIRPDFARATINLGNALLGMGRLAESAACYESGIRLDPTLPGARYNVGLMQLRAGEFQPGWANYEARWDFDELRLRRRNFAQPMWQGEPLAGRTILLSAEQGLGDTIQFVRYAPQIVAQGGQVVLEVQPPLVKLLGSMPGVSAIVARGKPLPDFDLYCPMMSLPRVMGTTLETIPSAGGYLSVFRDEMEAARRRYPGDGLRVGLAWAGNPKYKSDFSRSFPLEVLLPLGRIEGLPLFSLQKGPGTDQIAPLAHRWQLQDASSAHASMAETAALIATLDVVVSVDTSIAHLAGAMGKPVMVLLAHLADWRWMEQRPDSPWYESMQLFRQTVPGDWDGVVRRVADALRSLARQRRKCDERAEGIEPCFQSHAPSSFFRKTSSPR